MNMMFNLYSLSFQAIFITCLCCSFLLYFSLKRRQKTKTKLKRKSDFDYYNYCTSPDCLRCNAKMSNDNARYLYKKTLADQVDKSKLHKWYEQEADSNSDIKRQQPTVFCLPDLPTMPIIDPLVYKKDVITLESHCDFILEEYHQIRQFMEGWKLNTTEAGTWSMFYLYNQGRKVEANAIRCPKTIDLLHNLNNFMRDCSFGNACFSVLKYGCSISEHCGPCNVRIRCHLGLRIPNNWMLLVDNEKLHWKERACVLFDDSFRHSVLYKGGGSSSASRVVFMLDLWHYNVTENERNIIKQLYPGR